MEVEEVACLVEGEFEDFGDVFAFPADVFEDGGVAVAVALVAADVGFRHEGHFEFDLAAS